jgi:hypothetical protein
MATTAEAILSNGQTSIRLSGLIFHLLERYIKRSPGPLSEFIPAMKYGQGPETKKRLQKPF